MTANPLYSFDRGRWVLPWAVFLSSLAHTGRLLRAQSGPASDSQTRSSSAAAQAKFDAAGTSLTRGDTAGALIVLRRAIEADPEFLLAHERFVGLTMASIVHRDSTYHRTITMALDSLQQQYAAWQRRFPRSAGVQYGLGFAYTDAEDPRAKPYLLRAVELNPKLAKAYLQLWRDAQRWGDEPSAQHYIARAAELDSASPDYAFDVASSYQKTDPARWRTAVENLVRRIPASERAPQALFWLAVGTPNDSERMDVLERLRREFPADKFQWTVSGMELLYGEYVRRSPDRAVSLAQDMLERVGVSEVQADWATRLVVARDLLLANDLMSEHKYAAAAAVLDRVQLPPQLFGVGDVLPLLKAQALDAAQRTQASFDTLVAYYAATPRDTVWNAILRYGVKLGRDRRGADSAVWAVRDHAARPAEAFTLSRYTPPDSSSLAEYRGRIVLLTFWFPGCGPCRVEFPRMQRVVNTYQHRGLVYLGINVAAEQECLRHPLPQERRV